MELPLKGAAIAGSVKKKDSQIVPMAPIRANTKRFEVSPGKYVIIPFIQKNDPEFEFMLRLFSEMPASLELING